MRRLRGSTSQRRFIFIADTSSTTGAGLANLTHSSSGLVAYYIAGDLSNEVQITLVAGTLGTYVSGGFVAVDNTNMPGWYEIGIPDAALDGGNQVAIQYRGAANMAPVNIYIELDAVDYQDAAAFGLSRLDQTISSRASQTSVDTLSSYVDTEVAAIKAKTDLIQAFPTNFSLLMITGAGAIGLVDELGPQALSANSLEADIASQVWNTLTTGTFTDQSFGDRILISSNNTREVGVNGNGHVASVLHDAEPNSIPEDALQTGALSARVLASDSATEIATAVAATQALSRLDSMIESDGAGQFRFDTIALEMAPAGGGGGGGTDWTANERTAIRAILGIPTSGTTPTDPTEGILDEIRDDINAIGINVYPVQASTPERVQGTTLTFYRNESRSVSVVTDFTLTSLTLQFTVEDADGVDVYTLANGSITRSGQTFTVAVTTAVTGNLGQYRWSMRDISGGGSSVIAMGVLTVQEAASNV